MILRNYIFSRAGVETARAFRLLDELTEDLRTLINGNLSFEDNIASNKRTVQIDTAEDFTIILTTPTKPMAVQVLGAKNLATKDGRVLTGNVVEWEWRGGNVLVHSVTGLAANTRYDVELLILEK